MSMKITAGLGSIDDYIAYVEAGADEVFIGYVPERWTSKYGILSPLNRREVLYYNVQIGSRSELEILHDMYLTYKVPVQIALNALYYLPDQYPLVVDIMKECVEIGFDSFIVADMGLLLYLNKLRKDTTLSAEEITHNHWLSNLHLSISGEMSEMNSYLAKQLVELGADRIIFHRYTDWSSLASLVSERRPFGSTDTTQTITANFPYQRHNLCLEAFILNEKCHFNGAYCHSLHCDELCHMCHVPCKAATEIPAESSHEPVISPYDLADSEDFYLPGESGCGFCALWDFRDIGITHLKVVGRGNYSDDMIKDIRALKKALALLETSTSKGDYITNMKKEIFPYGCSHNCYY